MSTRPPTQALKTLTVLKSYAAATADNQVALVFETAQAGTIAFAVTDLGVPKLRKALAQIEQFLSQKTGQA